MSAHHEKNPYYAQHNIIYDNMTHFHPHHLGRFGNRPPFELREGSNRKQMKVESNYKGTLKAGNVATTGSYTLTKLCYGDLIKMLDKHVNQGNQADPNELTNTVRDDDTEEATTM